MLLKMSSVGVMDNKTGHCKYGGKQCQPDHPTHGVLHCLAKRPLHGWVQRGREYGSGPPGKITRGYGFPKKFLGTDPS